MNAKRILAGMAVAGGLAAGALGVSTGVASADTGSIHGAVPTSWATDHNDHGGWNGDHGRGGGWNNGPGWNNGGGWNGGGWNNGGGYYGGGPIPGGWNGGWEPNGGLCIGGLCV